MLHKKDDPTLNLSYLLSEGGNSVEMVSSALQSISSPSPSNLLHQNDQHQ